MWRANWEKERSCGKLMSSTNGLLEAISNVKQLSLSTRNLEGGVPAFENLNHLELTLGGSTCWRYLIEFLKRSQNLEYLVIKHILDSGEQIGLKHFKPLGSGDTGSGRKKGKQHIPSSILMKSETSGQNLLLKHICKLVVGYRLILVTLILQDI